MIIGLNGKNLSTKEFAGPEVFALNLYKNLLKIDRQNLYIIYLDKNPPESLVKEISGENTNVKFKIIPKVFSWTQISLALELLLNPVDVFFSPFHTVPGLTTILTLGKFKPTVFIHGLEYKVNQEFGGKIFNKIIHPFVLWWTCTVSKVIMVPSEATKNDLLNERFPFLKTKKIEIVREGVDESFYKRSSEEILQVKNKYKIGNDKYLLFVSTIQPRKNLPMLIHALSIAIKNHPSLHNLKICIAGKKGWNYEESLEAPKKYNVVNNVTFLGRVPNTDLPILLSGAEAFINVSFMEGFGLPVIEAMSCETPCVISDIPAFKEFKEGVYSFVNPYDPIQIADEISNVVLKPVDKNKIKQAKNLAEKFKWQNTATQALNLFQSIVKNL